MSWRILHRLRAWEILPIALIILASAAAAQKPYRGAEYRTSAAMTYGRFEVRMRSAPVSGMLGSFFTYYNPAAPWNEIDIEIMGRYTNEAQFNTIVPTQNDNHVQRQVAWFSPHAAFHVYAIEWTPQYVAWQVDGNEVFRQTGSHITQLSHPQQLMMNVWQPSAADWAGTFDPSKLPVYVYYDWVKYYEYTPGTNDNFTLQWVDNFDTFDTGRWQKSTHTFDGNNAQFVVDNAAFRDGYLILCLTTATTSGYSGGSIVDVDVDPPFPVSAVLYDSSLTVTFSEPVEQASAENPSHYAGGGLTFTAATLLGDLRTVRLAPSGTAPASSFPLIVQNIKDRATPAHVMPRYQAVNVLIAPQLPVRIDVGGPGTSAYIADSIWSAARAYGAVGGVVSTLPSSTTIAGTTEPEVYRTSLHGIGDYKVRVPNGTFKLTLMMVEDRHAAAGKRLFSAKAEGQTLFTDLDLFLRAGENTSFTFVAPAVQVTDNVLDLWFGASVDSTTLSGLQVERVSGSTGVNEGRSSLPEFSIAVYPNPFNAGTRLRYSLPRAESLRLSLHDILGHEVEDVNLGLIAAGSHEYNLETLRLASGVYFCRLSGDRVGSTVKVLLMK